MGSALALHLSRAGWKVLLLDAGASSSKICGEGLLPAAWECLQRLGVTPNIRSAGKIATLSYRLAVPGEERVEGLRAELSRPAWGVGRAALSAAFDTALAGSQVEVIRPARFRNLAFTGQHLELQFQVGTEHHSARTRFLIGADGLHSHVRSVAGLQGSKRHGWQRWGTRVYFRSRRSSDGVEVRLGDGLESYLTPLGDELFGLAFLWSPKRLGRPLPGEGALHERLLNLLPPVLRSELPCSGFEGTERAVGPLYQPVRSVLHRSLRVALVGDAGGYLDALTGQGLCLGLVQAESLSQLLLQRQLQCYPGVARREKFRYQCAVHALLWLMQRPNLRFRVFRALQTSPTLFRSLVQVAAEEAPLRLLVSSDWWTFLSSLAAGGIGGSSSANLQASRPAPPGA